MEGLGELFEEFLMQLVLMFRPLGRSPSRLCCWQKKGHEYPEDCDDNQELDQLEAKTSMGRNRGTRRSNR